MSKVDQIHSIRTVNNDLWMSILKIALMHAPEQTKKVLARIKKNDAKITKLMGDLVDE